MCRVRQFRLIRGTIEPQTTRRALLGELCINPIRDREVLKLKIATTNCQWIAFEGQHGRTKALGLGYTLLGADTIQPAAGLPFFSKVNLRKHAERLRAMQFGVGLIGI